MEIHGLNKTTLLDYPEHVAATVFTGHCNFRCPFCQNGDLVLAPEGQPVMDEDEVLDFLGRRKNILSGLCITGGEPTLQVDLEEFILKVRGLGYEVKLDTNGYRPEVLRRLVERGLLDYVAMDVKSSPGGYAEAAGVEKIDLARIRESVELLKEGAVPYEFRTTVVRELHGREEMEEIGQWLAGSRAYYLQSYEESEGVIRPGFHAVERERLEEFADLLRRHIGKVELRGVD